MSARSCPSTCSRPAMPSPCSTISDPADRASLHLCAHSAFRLRPRRRARRAVDAHAGGARRRDRPARRRRRRAGLRPRARARRRRSISTPSGSSTACGSPGQLVIFPTTNSGYGTQATPDSPAPRTRRSSRSRSTAATKVQAEAELLDSAARDHPPAGDGLRHVAAHAARSARQPLRLRGRHRPATW